MKLSLNVKSTCRLYAKLYLIFAIFCLERLNWVRLSELRIDYIRQVKLG
jgi:hypothetical protein